MKDFKLPVLQEKERKEAWSQLKVNDKLTFIQWNSWTGTYAVRELTIINKTPKGRLRLEDGTLLSELPSCAYTSTDELAKCIEQINLDKEIISLLFKANNESRKFLNNLDYNDGIQLKEILEEILEEIA